MSQAHGAPASATPNPCLTCGACCTLYRVLVHWSETTLGDDLGPRDPGAPRVPVELTEPLGLHTQVMKGTVLGGRCAALLGDVGGSIRCAIHEVRSTPCREFERSWENGRPNERCDRARASIGLPPIPPPLPLDEDDPSPDPGPPPEDPWVPEPSDPLPPDLPIAV